jgi:hypothetical protein
MGQEDGIEQEDAEDAEMKEEKANVNCKEGIANCKSLARLIASAISALSCSMLLFAAAPALAQAPLRWQLKEGQSLAVKIDQVTTTKVAFSGKSADTKIELGLELRWTVDSVADGQFKIKQTVERITFSLEPQTGAAVKYDSQDKTRPSGQARQVADAVKPLLGAEVLITMSNRGQVVATAPANAAAEKLFASDDPENGVFSRQSVETLLRQPLAVLPEKPVTDGDKWSEEPREIASAAGNFTQATEHVLAGQVEEEEGKTLAKIESKATLTPAVGGAAKAAKLTVKSHEQTGTILFSTDEGRLVRAEQAQKLSTARPYRETVIAVALDSKQTTTIGPAQP